MDSPTRPRPAATPAEVLDLFLRDAMVHPYGIADVEQLWDVSRWWREGEAVVGAMDLPGADFPVVYAVSARDPDGTLDLLERLTPVLPDRFGIHGPVGAARRLAGSHTTAWLNAYWKMGLVEPQRLPATDPRVRPLTRADLPALLELFDTDPVAGDFFHPGLLDTGHYVGVDEGTDLIACAGIHVVDTVNRVAALGNVATRPDRRRRGLGAATVATLCHRLLAEVDVIGLNVRQVNDGARRLYERLGFSTLLPYEEAELRRS